MLRVYTVLYVMLHQSSLAGVTPPDSALSVHSNQHFTPLPPQEKLQVITGAIVESLVVSPPFLRHFHYDVVGLGHHNENEGEKVG